MALLPLKLTAIQYFTQNRAVDRPSPSRLPFLRSCDGIGCGEFNLISEVVMEFIIPVETELKILIEADSEQEAQKIAAEITDQMAVVLSRMEIDGGNLEMELSIDILK